MRNLKLLLVVGVTALLCACGGYDSNRHLGKIPAMYQEKAKESSRITAKEPSSRDGTLKQQEKLEKLSEKYEKLAREEFATIEGNEIPFDMAYDDPNFEVESVKITNIAYNTGNLTLAVKVKAKRPMTASEYEMQYVVLSSKDVVINTGRLNPFAGDQLLNRYSYSKRVSSGQLCNDNGTKILLWLSVYDMTDFGRLLFVEKGSMPVL